jgi:hypothetical protein
MSGTDEKADRKACQANFGSSISAPFSAFLRIASYSLKLPAVNWFADSGIATAKFAVDAERSMAQDFSSPGQVGGMGGTVTGLNAVLPIAHDVWLFGQVGGMGGTVTGLNAVLPIAHDVWLFGQVGGIGGTVTGLNAVLPIAHDV